ncbi:alpha-N-acetylglucosaminidase C-terminal domain-containing protein [Streptomyces sp. 5K101]|uniref:alpha-N-acetylglucosaminidase C-terminal domain-containing protein n=1 Tax=Streptomyces sp. 5K101 TaxID=3390037 RepID=UPI003976C6D4
MGAPASRAWRSKPGSALKGIAYLPEGTGGYLLAYELFTELAWRTGPLDHRAWFAAYAERRYGGADPHAAKAWELLRTGPYSTPSGPWLADARSWGTTDAERATAEFDARSVLTTWGHRSGSDNGGLRDYANREWSGLVSGFYAKRWAAVPRLARHGAGDRAPPCRHRLVRVGERLEPPARPLSGDARGGSRGQGGRGPGRPARARGHGAGDGLRRPMRGRHRRQRRRREAPGLHRGYRAEGEPVRLIGLRLRVGREGGHRVEIAPSGVRRCPTPLRHKDITTHHNPTI